MGNISKISYNGTLYQISGSGDSQGQASGMTQAEKTALSSFIGQMAQLIPSLAFSSASHNGASAVSAANAAVTALENGGESEPATYTVTRILSHCTATNTAATVTHGSRYMSTLTASTGYELSSVSITMGGTNITSTAYSSQTGVISIASVTGNIVITATAAQTQTVYIVTNTLSNCANSNTALTVAEGSAYTGTITASSGYAMSSVTVTMGGTNITSTAYNNVTGTISIASVTGNIVITAMAAQITHTVSKTLTHCTATNADTVIPHGNSYSATVTADSGYTMGAVTVTMGGTDITSTAYSSQTGVISIASVTGNIVITASAAANQVNYTSEAIYTNYTATGARFSTDNISINFANGDYVEAKIDPTACTVDATNILTIAKSGSTDYLDYSTGEGILIYKRLQSGVDKVLFRIKDTANSASKDVWVVPADMSDLTIKLDKNGVYLDGTAVSGISVSDLAFLTGESAIAIGARASKLSYATYSSVTVYRAS